MLGVFPWPCQWSFECRLKESFKKSLQRVINSVLSDSMRVNSDSL